MPLVTEYVSAQELKDAIGQKTALADADIQRAVSSASRAIDLLTGRRFGKTDAEETWKFKPTSRDFLVVDDMVSVTSVLVQGSELSTDQWDAYPLNADKEGRPFLWLESDDRHFGTKTVEVTGTFGWPNIPDTVEQFTIILASKFLKRTREAPWGVVSTGGLDGLMVRLAREDPDLMLLVSQLVRPETVV